MHTFGEDGELAARLVAAYIRGFQGEELGPQSVACMTKHFPGGGPQLDGEDPHFAYGKDQVYPGGMFEYHMRVFEAAFEAGTAQIMPYYGRPVGTPLEEVGFGFNRDVVTGLLRERYGFDGVVCTDWGLVTDAPLPDGSVFAAKCWGVEELGVEERLVKIVEAGCDQLGGEELPEVLVELVHAGRIAEERIDESARRLLRDKFRLGLFDDPYVDPDEAERTCGSPPFRAKGERAQRRSAVVISNDGVLPLREGVRVYADGLAYEGAAESPGEADVAIVRRNTPFEPRTNGMIESLFHAGDLDFKEPELSTLLELARTVPTGARPPPRAAGRDSGARRGVRSGRSGLRCVRRGGARRSLRPDETRGQAAVRAAVVDGRRAGAAPGCAGRLARPAVPPRARARPLGR